jgi:CubicO group peptidase (beta-lactamase class C family)
MFNFRVFAAVALFAFCLIAPEPSLAQPASTATRLDQWVRSFAEAQKFNGAVLVIEAGKPIYNQAFGKADLEAGTPLSTSSRFNLAEASQPFTAVAILQLKEQGKLTLDDELSTYIPELRSFADVTLRQLLSHTSGIPGYETTMSIHWDKTKVATNRDLIRTLSAHPPALEFRPGERYQNSPTNYALLASVVERVSGQEFAAYCAQHLFAPSGMTQSQILTASESKSAVRARGYRTFLLRTPERNDQSYLEGIVGDKNVLTCTDDLVKWEAALTENKLLKAASLSEMVVNATVRSGVQTQHGYAWALPSGLGRRVAEVSGQLGGFGVVYTRLLDDQHTIVVLTNTQFGKLFALADGCYNIVTGIAPRDPRIPVGLLLADLYQSQGLQVALNRYSAIRNTAAQRGLYDLRESELNVLGQELLELGKAKDAIEIFRLNTEAYPRSFNVYDSLAEAYLLDGQRENAIVNYRKSLSLYPENANATAQLAKLNAGAPKK